jgi:hypothetical protein
VLAEGAAATERAPEPVTAIPGLAPVLVAEEAEVDELVRTARAGVALLSLQVRNAKEEASRAAAASLDWDLDAARALLTTTIEERMRARRVQMAQELEATRTDAARLVLATRSEAAAMITAAGEETLDVLLAGTAPAAVEAPSLRAVGGAPPDADADIREVEQPHAASDARGARPPEPALSVVSVTPLGEPAPMVAPAEAPEPVVEPDLVVTPPAPAAIPQPTAMIEAPGPAPTVCVPVGPASEVVTAAAAAAAAVAAPAPAPAAVPGPGRSRLAQFLYVDVLLPMVAVLVILVVLLAWIG